MKSYLTVALVAFALSFAFCYALIPVLRKLKAGQNILSFVKEHSSKSGTPTMGGIAFISAAVLTVALFLRRGERVTLVTLAIGLSYMIVGLLDDFLKRKHKQNLGLRAWQKFAFQACIALLAGIFCYRAGLTEWYLPFTK
ncbi:MAG: phospho-N-acetylmuramoyl-pentapeptide-transferase, partial [Clostridia bacterium]|nr:phospho-N-acetylmuramoyl-pentapeptide-transferase [Clostridia bacterium]